MPPKTKEGWKALRVPMPLDEFEYLSKLRGPRKWRTFLKEIQDDARKAAEVNRHLRERVEFLEAQRERDRVDFLAQLEGKEG